MLNSDTRAQHSTAEKQHEKKEIHLHISCGENTSSPMMFSLKPVGIYLPVDVNNVASLQWELPEEIKNNHGKSKKELNKDTSSKIWVYRLYQMYIM